MKLRTYFLASAIAALFAATAMHTAHARDGWDKGERPRVCGLPDVEHKKCLQWIAKVQQPLAAVSCCGEADAFVADDFDVVDGNIVAIITEEYVKGIRDDGDGGTEELIAYPIGTRIPIPKDRLNPQGPIKGDNPTKHGIVFINGDGQVLCYFLPPLG